jgi:hypothetical protein
MVFADQAGHGAQPAFYQPGQHALIRPAEHVFFDGK